jgi:NIMA (never in mitosis gene a)-related kinase
MKNLILKLCVYGVVAGSAVAFQPSPTLARSATSKVMSPLTMVPEVVDASYDLAIGTLGVGLVGGVVERVSKNKLFGGIFLLFTIFAAFIAFQTTTLRFAFDDDSFSLQKAGGASFENVVVGGENKWAYKSFQNYDFLPSPSFPILVYFREDQTPVEAREEAPIVVDDLVGQVHFFPAIANTQQLTDGFAKHNCAKL